MGNNQQQASSKTKKKENQQNKMFFVGWDKPTKELDAYFQTEDTSFLLVSGPVGVGKSDIPRYYATKHGYELIEVASTVELNFMHRRQKKKCLLCIDDYESASAYFQGFDNFFRKMVRKGPPVMKVFLCGTDVYPLQRMLLDANVTHIRLFPPFPSAIRSLLPSKSWKIANVVKGDVRKALQLERLRWGDSKSEELSDFDAATMILGDRPNHNCKHTYTLGAVEWAFHNYLDDVEDIEDVVDFSERFSAVSTCREALLSLKKPTPMVVPKRSKLSWKHRGELQRLRQCKGRLTTIGEKFGLLGMPKEEMHHYLRCVRRGYILLSPSKRKQFSNMHGMTVDDKRFIFAKRCVDGASFSFQDNT